MTHAPGDLDFVIGTTGVAGARREVRASAAAYAVHSVIAGSSGSGKTQFELAMTAQTVARSPSAPVILVDPKSDLLAVTRFLAALIPTLSVADSEAVLSNFRLVSPFRDQTLEMNMLAPNGDEPEVQALGVLDAIEAALDSDLAGFERLAALLLSCITAGIEGGCTLLDVPRMVTDQTFRRNLVERLPSGRSKETLDSRVRLAPAATVGAVVARLDRLFTTSVSRRLLSSPGCFSWGSRLAHGVTVLDVCDPPGGQPALQKLFGGYLLQTLATSLLSRPVSDATEPLTLVIDELPELLTGKTATELGRLLALVRYRKVGVHLLYQDESQLEKRAPELLSLVRANARRLVMFRGHPASLKWIEPFLPPPVVRGPASQRDDRSSAFHADHARRLLGSMSSLPTMIAFHVDRASGQPGEFIATPRLDLADIERRARAAPERVRRILRLVPPALADVSDDGGAHASARVQAQVEVVANPAEPKVVTAPPEKESADIAAPASPLPREPDAVSATSSVSTIALDRFILGWVPGAPLPAEAP